MPSNRARASGVQLDSRLERLLRTDAAAAPLPQDVLRVPRAWVRGRRQVPTAQIGRVLAIAGVIAAAIVMMVALPRIWQVGTDMAAGPLTAEGAAALADVPQGQVVATRDGFLALKIIEPAGDVQVMLITDADPEPVVKVLTQVPMAIINIQPNSSLLWVEALSCSPDRGMQQPNMLFGYTQPPPSRVSLNVPARWTAMNGFFLVALEDAVLAPNQQIMLDLGSGRDRRPASHFAESDACTGEPPVGH